MIGENNNDNDNNNLLRQLDELELFEEIVLVGLVLLLSHTVELGEDAVQRDLSK